MKSQLGQRPQHCNQPALRSISWGALLGCAVGIVVLLFDRPRAQLVAQSSWTAPSNISQVEELTSDSPVLLCDATQNVHLIWLERDADTAYIYYRTDADDSWSETYNIFAVPLITYLDATITPDGLLHLVWISSNDSTLFYSRAPLDRAYSVRDWTEPLVLATNLEYGGNVFAGSGTIVADDGGDLYVVFATMYTDEGLEHGVQYIRSEDSGISWSTPANIAFLISPVTSNVFPSMAIDGSGRLHVGWSLRSYEYGVYSTLGYVRSTDAGVTWSEVREIASAQRGDTYFGVAMLGVFAFGDDEVHLTWDTPTRWHQWSADGGASWSTPQEIMELGAAFGGFNKLAMDSGGRLHVVSAVGEGVFHSFWMGSYWAAPDVIDDRSFDPHGQQLLVCQGNHLHVVYHDRTAENEIWYSTAVVDSPPLPRGPIPTVTSDRLGSRVRETATVAANEPDDLDVSITPARRFSTQAPDYANVSQATDPLLLGVGSSVVLLLIVFVIVLKKRSYG